MFKVSSRAFCEHSKEALFTDINKAMEYYTLLKNEIFFNSDTGGDEFVCLLMKKFGEYQPIKKYDYELYEKDNQYQMEIYNKENNPN